MSSTNFSPHRPISYTIPPLPSYSPSSSNSRWAFEPIPTPRTQPASISFENYSLSPMKSSSYKTTNWASGSFPGIQPSPIQPKPNWNIEPVKRPTEFVPFSHPQPTLDFQFSSSLLNRVNQVASSNRNLINAPTYIPNFNLSIDLPRTTNAKPYIDMIFQEIKVNPSRSLPSLEDRIFKSITQDFHTKPISYTGMEVIPSTLRNTIPRAHPAYINPQERIEVLKGDGQVDYYPLAENPPFQRPSISESRIRVTTRLFEGWQQIKTGLLHIGLGNMELTPQEKVDILNASQKSQALALSVLTDNLRRSLSFSPERRLSGLAKEGFYDLISNPRFQGSMQAFAGLGEISAGAAISYSSGPLGFSVLAHGLDNFITGSRAVLTKEQKDTATSQLLQKTGLPRGAANFTDGMIGIVSNIKGAAVLLPAKQPIVAHNFKLIKDQLKADNAGWILPEKGGAIIQGRWYTEHALERMAPNIPQVMARLESRTLERAAAEGVQVGTEKYRDWMLINGPKPRGIPPLVIEAEIANPGSTNLRVILNEKKSVITVIPGEK